MPLMRRVATLGAAVAAARQYARQNPEKVNRYADQAAAFIDQRTHGRYRRQLDNALRQVRKETSVPGQQSYGAGRPGQFGSGRTGGHDPQQHRTDQNNGSPGFGARRYPSERTDR